MMMMMMMMCFHITLSLHQPSDPLLAQPVVTLSMVFLAWLWLSLLSGFFALVVMANLNYECLSPHLITSSQLLMLLLAVVVYVLQTWTISLCLAADLARTAAGLFIMLSRQSGTRCQMNLEILTASIVLNSFRKQSSLAATSVTSALEVIFLYKSTFYLLTYLLFVNCYIWRWRNFTVYWTVVEWTCYCSDPATNICRSTRWESIYVGHTITWLSLQQHCATSMSTSQFVQILSNSSPQATLHQQRLTCTSTISTNCMPNF